jgi:hypothetical protein
MNTAFGSLDLVPMTIDTESLAEIECTRCDATLCIHQPDEQLGERLLGTCPDCFAWYLIDADVGLMVLLPDETDLRIACPCTDRSRRSVASGG